MTDFSEYQRRARTTAVPNSEGVGGMVREWNLAVGRDTGLSLNPSLVEEEVRELREACDHGDRAKIAKEACDVVWTAVDVLVAHGIDFDTAFAELNRSNLSKVGPKGQVYRRGDGKVLKGPYFSPARPDVLLGRDMIRGDGDER